MSICRGLACWRISEHTWVDGFNRVTVLPGRRRGRRFLFALNVDIRVDMLRLQPSNIHAK
jgi:hypothetical protein